MNKKLFSQSFLRRLVALLAYSAIFFFLIEGLQDAIFFLVGVVCAVVFLVGDESYFYRWYQENDQQFLVTRSPLFLFSLPPMAIIVLTSFGSFWASGLVGGMMLWILLEMFSLRTDPAAFQNRFLRTTSTSVSSQTIQAILISGALFFLLIHGLVAL